MKENLIDLFWKVLCITIIVGIVICCIAGLWDKKVVNVSFVKDVYSGLFTVIAPLIAIYLFNDWKEQHNKTVLSDEAKVLWHKFKSLEKKTYALDDIYLQSGQIQNFVFFKSTPNLNKATFDLINEYDKSYPELNYFIELAKDKNNNVHQNYYGAIKDYRDYIETIVLNTTIGEIYETEEDLRNNLITENKNIRIYLSDFILIK